MVCLSKLGAFEDLREGSTGVAVWMNIFSIGYVDRTVLALNCNDVSSRGYGRYGATWTAKVCTANVNLEVLRSGG